MTAAGFRMRAIDRNISAIVSPSTVERYTPESPLYFYMTSLTYSLSWNRGARQRGANCRPYLAWCSVSSAAVGATAHPFSPLCICADCAGMTGESRWWGF